VSVQVRAQAHHIGVMQGMPARCELLEAGGKVAMRGMPRDRERCALTWHTVCSDGVFNP